MLGFRIFAIFLIFCLLKDFECIHPINSGLPLMLLDFLKANSRLNKIFTSTCWSKDYEKYFQKTLQNQAMSSNYNLKDVSTLKEGGAIFLDLSCLEAKEILENAETHELFSLSFFWMMLEASSVILENFKFPPSSNVYLMEHNLYGYSVKNIYSPSAKMNVLSQTLVGYWTYDNGYIEVINSVNQNIDRKLMETDVKVSYVVEDHDTIQHLNDYRYKILIDSTTKYNYAILEHLFYLVNVTKEEVFRNRYYSEEVDGKKLTGMIDDIRNGDYLIGGNPIEFVSDCVNEFDFLAKTTKTERKFIFRATPHSYISNVFTLPFDTYVWYSCFGLMVAIFIVAYLVEYWEWKDPVFRKYLSPRFTLRPDPVDIFLMEVGSAAQQGFESEPRSNAGRIMFIFTLISLMFLYTSFSANIVALLQSTSERINTLEHLLDSRIPVGYENNISMKYFEEMNFDSKNREFYNKIHKPVFYTIEEGVRKIKEEFFAFYADTASIYKYISDSFWENEKCGLREIPFRSSYVDYWLIMKKNTSYKDLFRAGMQKINEVGLRTREYRRMFTSKPKCDSEGGSFESVGLADSYGAFLFMAVGVALSLMLLLFELAWKRYPTFKQGDMMNILEGEDKTRENYQPDDLIESPLSQKIDFGL